MKRDLIEKEKEDPPPKKSDNTLRTDSTTTDQKNPITEPFKEPMESSTSSRRPSNPPHPWKFKVPQNQEPHRPNPKDENLSYISTIDNSRVTNPKNRTSKGHSNDRSRRSSK